MDTWDFQMLGVNKLPLRQGFACDKNACTAQMRRPAVRDPG
jgi:hypothetical protein